MSINGISGGTYSFSGGGSLTSIRNQAYAIGERVKAESQARIAEQERTGLIKNPENGEIVELSSVSQETRNRWEQIEQARSVSPQEAMIGFMATSPHAEEIERSKELGAMASKIQCKMLAGKKLSGEEKEFLREHFPELAAKAARMEQEARSLEQKLQRCRTKEEARQVYMEAKRAVMNSVDKNDCSALFYFAALDATYAEYSKEDASSQKKIDCIV